MVTSAADLKHERVHFLPDVRVTQRPAVDGRVEQQV